MVCAANTVFNLENPLSPTFKVDFFNIYSDKKTLIAFNCPVSRLAIIVGTEYAWNVFPSTDLSSGLLVTANVALLVGLWYGWDHARDPVQVATKKKMK